MRYEIYSGDDGLRWRFVDLDGTVLVSAPRPLTLDQCIKTVQIMQATVGAPVIVLQESPNLHAELVGEPQSEAKAEI
jgi:hypothetical protein